MMWVFPFRYNSRIPHWRTEPGKMLIAGEVIADADIGATHMPGKSLVDKVVSDSSKKSHGT